MKKILMSKNLHGLRKICFANNSIFALDMQGFLYSWEEEENWKETGLSNIVDISTDSFDDRNDRKTLFVLSQSESLRTLKPNLKTFMSNRSYSRGRERIFDKWFQNRGLIFWYYNGAPKAGDHVDVYRVNEFGRLRRVFKMSFQQNHKFLSISVSNRDRYESSRHSLSERKFINEVQMRTTKGRVWSIIVNEPELVASGGGAQISLQNITSRFDLDDENYCTVTDMINGPTVTALLSAQGNIHIFSDKNAHMLEMFSDRPMFYTECKSLHEIENSRLSSRLSTTINLGVKIIDLALSETHLLSIDSYGRLWVVGQNKYGQLGLGNFLAKVHPILVRLPRNLKRIWSVCATMELSSILAENIDGEKEVYVAGKLDHFTFMGYNLILDKDKILAQDQSLYQKSRQVTRFTKVLINLDSKIDTMIMSKNHVSFVSRHGIVDSTTNKIKVSTIEARKCTCRFCLKQL